MYLQYVLTQYKHTQLNFRVDIKYLLFFSIADAQFKCPPKDGQYEDANQCDKFYDCQDGVAVEKLCPDGLVFDPTIRKINKCDQPFNADCGDRNQLRMTIFLLTIFKFILFFFYFIECISSNVQLVSFHLLEDFAISECKIDLYLEKRI